MLNELGDRRNIFFESSTDSEESLGRKYNSFSSLHLTINGATHVLSTDAECAGALQFIFSP